MSEAKKRGLGRGLSTLMADVAIDPVKQSTAPPAADSTLPIEQLHPNPDQPRRRFSEVALEELAESIRERGIIQPLIVRPAKDGFQIVAGERRWRAAQRAQLHVVPVIIRDLSDTEVLEVAIVENIQRADLDSIEEALGYRQLMDRFKHTQEQVAKALGKSRSHIANLLRLLQLPDDVQSLVQEGRLSAGHARALITTDDPSGLAKIVVSRDLSVRDTEKLASRDSKKVGKSTTSSTKDADTRALELDLTANLGLGVTITHKGDDGAGSMTLNYKTLEELDAICRVLSASPLDVKS